MSWCSSLPGPASQCSGVPLTLSTAIGGVTTNQLQKLLFCLIASLISLTYLSVLRSTTGDPPCTLLHTSFTPIFRIPNLPAPRLAEKPAFQVFSAMAAFQTSSLTFTCNLLYLQNEHTCKFGRMYTSKKHLHTC